MKPQFDAAKRFHRFPGFPRCLPALLLAGCAGAASAQMQGGAAPADARDPDAYSDPADHPGSTGHAMTGMADQARFGSVLVDRLERAADTEGPARGLTRYDIRAWYGGTYDKAVVKAEGEVLRGKVPDNRTELLWSHAVAAYWDTQLGLRSDAGSGRPSRNWLAFGVQGLAPYWFELEATAYLGDGGRSALRLNAEYELLVTQRLVLQPRAEASLYGRDDPQAHIGRGLSSATVGLRLRYEINRQFAPYVGVERGGAVGRTADLLRAAGEPGAQTRWVAGVRMWF